MHSALRTIMQSQLSAPAKALAALLYTYADQLPVLLEIPVTDVTTALGVGESRLRSYRAELTACGVLGANQTDGLLLVDLYAGITAERIQAGLDHRAAERARRAETARIARGADESARYTRGVDESARIARALEPENRAPSARCAPAEGGEIPLAQHEQSAPATPHTPLQGISLINQQQVNPPAAQEGVAGETARRGARLLRAVGVHPDLADDLARQKTYEALCRHVAAWQIARQHTPGLTAGALVERIRNWDLPRALEWPDMQSGVLAEHVTEADLRQWRFHKPHNPLAAYDAPAGYDGIIKH